MPHIYAFVTFKNASNESENKWETPLTLLYLVSMYKRFSH